MADEMIMETVETPVEETIEEEPEYTMRVEEKALLKQIKKAFYTKTLSKAITLLKKSRLLVEIYYTQPEVQEVEGAEMDRRMVMKYFDDIEYQMVKTQDKVVQSERKKIDPFKYKSL